MYNQERTTGEVPEFSMSEEPRSAHPRAIGPGESSNVTESDVTDRSNNPSGLEETDDTPIPSELNLLPLRDAVIYPQLVAPLSVGRDGSVRLIDETMPSSTKVIGVVTQRNPEVDEPGFEDIYDIGCVAIVRTMLKMHDATRLIVQGVKRFRIVERLQEKPYLRARIEAIPEPVIPKGQEDQVEALRRLLANLFEEAIKLSPNLPSELEGTTDSLKGPQALTDLVAAHLNLSVEEKQSVLEELELIPRMERVLRFATREVRILELTSKLHNEVTFELTKTQREYYLREQQKAIQRELGEGSSEQDDLQELAERLLDAQLPEEAMHETHRELRRLSQLNPASPEYGVVRTYLETVASLPWAPTDAAEIDLDEVEATLEREHYGLKQVKERILAFLAVHQLKGHQAGRHPILCLVGPPGVGKTSLGKSVASALQRTFARISLGGMRDESEIRGHRRTYIGAMPGQIIQMIRRSGVNNPVLLLDEIDKLGRDLRGDPGSALLEVLDPEQNHAFRDHYLDLPFDLSRIFFIATANSLDNIPPALLDRMEVIELGGYTEREKLEIARRHLVPKQISENGLRPGQVAFDAGALTTIARHYTREAGVRNLERQIASVLRKVAMLFAKGRKSKLNVTPKLVLSFLGAARYLHTEVNERPLRPGMAIGLAWTATGGEVLFVETNKFPNKPGLTVTGQLGDVMRESITTALSFLRSQADSLGINPAAFQESEIHVHLPAGAVPKDGPSAGVTILAALASLFTEKQPRSGLAMSGEITLTGMVLPVGGIKEKVISAHRAGITELILPRQNEKDWLEDVPEEVRAQLKVHFVERGEQVLDLTL